MLLRVDERRELANQPLPGCGKPALPGSAVVLAKDETTRYFVENPMTTDLVTPATSIREYEQKLTVTIGQIRMALHGIEAKKAAEIISELRSSHHVNRFPLEPKTSKAQEGH